MITSGPQGVKKRGRSSHDSVPSTQHCGWSLGTVLDDLTKSHGVATMASSGRHCSDPRKLVFVFSHAAPTPQAAQEEGRVGRHPGTARRREPKGAIGLASPVATQACNLSHTAG